MHTSALFVALVAAAVPAGDKKPEWMTSYGQAQKQGQSAGKPLAVFLAPGKEGWQQLVREGKLSKEALEQLADGYVCVHLDTTTDNGKKYAKAFEMPSGLGVVLSDRSGERQEFRHEGSLDVGVLTSALTTHSGQTVMRTSYYPAESGSSRVIDQGTIIQGRIQSYGVSSGGSRSCSS
jgi:hypothetical protein